jgi:3-deoxy-D-manno-octulosonate 8-phosphate phosphatase (KDO 8-P phosphatase)
MTIKLDQRCHPIRLILSDVDGVLTDGGVVLDNRGIETKTFHIRDGSGVKLWQRAGNRFGVITGRNSHIVQLRMAELDVIIVRQGVEDKLAVVKQIMEELNLQPENVCYVGDDLPDLPALRSVGLAVAVADAAEEVRRESHYVTSVGGGRGAVREIIEVILKNQRRWEDLIQKYQGM